MTNFHSLGLSKQLVSTLSALGYETPTPIQAQAIPLLLESRDMIGLAQTGTGKTAAFGLPLIEMLLKDPKRPDNRTTRTLILAPTRELVNQIATNLKSYVRGMPLKINSVVGGASINKQQLQLEKGTDILVATPGRLLDLVARKAIGLTTVRYLVLDEADQMLDLGFVHDLRKIAKMVPARRQTLLFSATMPKAIADLAGDYLKDPVKIEVTPPGKAADKIEQYVHFVAGKNDKTELLKTSLLENPDGRAIVFLRTKHGAEKLSKHLEHLGFEVASIHGNKSQGQRERALKAFRDGDIRVLVATDVAARGIDIPGVTHVFNYDLPEVPDAYVHRIGRTARAGRDGVAIAFCAPDETRLLRDIEKLMNIDITVASGERPAGLNSPVRSSGKPARNGGGRSEGNREGGNRNRAENRAPRRPRTPEGEALAERAGPRGGERNGPARNKRNEDFRGQRRGEEAPRFEADNDLVDTSDFGQARKKQFGPKPGAGDNRKRGNGGENRHAPHAPHEPAQQRQARNGQQPRKPSGNGGPVKFGGEGRNGGNQPRRRDRA
ncbi:DEAD/DEAH box helicase [Rhizobium oryzicola]|uniref:DEAD/DEAH box helicase n=1 Tax=Rhizobium oryzicola TaxID=1232668 RepID=A0ABT8SUX2_9HYPH|nr:DEAD/DEAH box helicase [Rhizobium oryzicola]MDO1582223.1 DEAD/DEAH box helicase [Rhizobium oryzicola]